jgi:hypothetical protein
MDLKIHLQRLVNSFRHFSGRDFIALPPNTDLVHFLHEAPFALVSHGTEADPIFNYANKTAQRLWEMDWDEFTSTPSRLSAEPMRREERELLLQQVAQFGFAEKYEGIRISKTGKRFWIRNTTVWNVLDEQGHYIGQAASYSKWDFIE